jgi:capsular polysaccharide biosynthesis protein
MADQQDHPTRTAGTDVQLGEYVRVLVRNWWLIVILAVIGAVVAAGFTLATPKKYEASSAVYLGQVMDASGSIMTGLSSNPAAAVELLKSDSVLQEAARRVGHGETAANLAAGVTSETPTQTIKGSLSVVNFVVIHVTDTKRTRAAEAANVLAQIVLEHIAGGPSERITLLQQLIAQDQAGLAFLEILSQAGLAAATARSAAAQAALDAINRGSGTADEKAAASVGYLTILTASAGNAASYVSALQSAQLQLQVAQVSGQPQVLYKAVPPVSASSSKTKSSVALGLVAGLIVGVLAAFARDRLRRPQAAA